MKVPAKKPYKYVVEFLKLLFGIESKSAKKELESRRILEDENEKIFYETFSRLRKEEFRIKSIKQRILKIKSKPKWIYQ